MSSTRRAALIVACLLALALVAAACGSDDGGEAASDDDRCEANRAAGTITYITSFDFAAAVSILDVVVAEAEGYFEQMCLDVELVPGFAPGNGALVASGQGQMSSAGSFAELVNNNVQGETDLVAVATYGKTAIEAFAVPEDGVVRSVKDLDGASVGVRGDLPYSLQALVASAGVERSSLDEVILETFDPVAEFELGLDAIQVYKSNEPNQLAQAGVGFRLLDPLEADIPASFGVFFTSQSFLDEHPTAVEDFVRAARFGFDFAVDDPETAVAHSLAKIDAASTLEFWFEGQEQFRWSTESGLVLASTIGDAPIGSFDVDRLKAEIDTLTDLGVFETTPEWEEMFDSSIIDTIHDGTDLIWPGPVEG